MSDLYDMDLDELIYEIERLTARVAELEGQFTEVVNNYEDRIEALKEQTDG